MVEVSETPMFRSGRRKDNDAPPAAGRSTTFPSAPRPGSGTSPLSAPGKSHGLNELRAARRESAGLFGFVFLFSVFFNLLMLTGPIYMLQVYDRVIASRSEETLIALSILLCCRFLALGILAHARANVMSVVGARFQDRLDRRVFSAAIRRSTVTPNDPAAIAAQRDLESVQRLLGSPVMLALFDIPWSPLFIAAIFVFHPWLGWLAIGGGTILIIVTMLNQWTTKAPQSEATVATLRSERMSDQLKSEAELVQALGMTEDSFDRWQTARKIALARTVEAGSRTSVFSSATKTFRLFLQSAILGLGAWLVLQNEMTAGAMMAASILMGRGLAPIETAVGQWANVHRAREGWGRLSELLSTVPVEPAKTALPRPKARLVVENLTVMPPGERTASLRNVSFQVEPGQALGVIGPSGSGKSTLGRALIGVWQPSQGTVRLDGSTLDQYDRDVLGTYIGYLPQRVTLFDGTVAENIARLAKDFDHKSVIAAAQKAAGLRWVAKAWQGGGRWSLSAGGRISRLRSPSRDRSAPSLGNCEPYRSRCRRTSRGS